jgi:hypothetical protein
VEGALPGTDRPIESYEEVQAQRQGTFKEPEPLPIKLRQPEEVVKLAEEIEKRRGVIPDEDLVWATTRQDVTFEENMKLRKQAQKKYPFSTQTQQQPQQPQQPQQQQPKQSEK